MLIRRNARRISPFVAFSRTPRTSYAVAASARSFASPIDDAASARARRLRGARARFATRDDARDGSIRAAVARMMRQGETRECDARDARSGMPRQQKHQPTDEATRRTSGDENDGETTGE